MIENRGVLASDVWGAACEAVAPQVAKLNWNPRDRFKFESAMETVRAVQRRYFSAYFELPAQCPGSVQRFTKAGGRVINRKGDLKIEWENNADLGGVTSECGKVRQLAGLIDHMFYKHGWSREECARAVEWYENKQANQIAINFNHFQMN